MFFRVLKEVSLLQEMSENYRQYRLFIGLQFFQWRFCSNSSRRNIVGAVEKKNIFLRTILWWSILVICWTGFLLALDLIHCCQSNIKFWLQYLAGKEGILSSSFCLSIMTIDKYFVVCCGVSFFFFPSCLGFNQCLVEWMTVISCKYCRS